MVRPIDINNNVNKPGYLDISYKCPFCGEISIVTIPESEWDDYAFGGELVQNAIHASPEIREIMVSGICIACQDSIFNGSEE